MCYFKSIKGCVLSLVILLYSLNFNFVEAFYLQTDTAFYVKNFGNVTLGSYTTPLPTALTNACAGKTFKYASFANINNISLPAVYLTVNMNSTKAQNICGTKSKCVVNSGVTLFMNSNLNVAALLVRGQVIWNDRTQRTSTQYLCAGYVVMEDYGRFNMSLVNPQHTAYIYLKDNGYAHPSNLQIRVFGGVDMSGGTKPIIDVTGRPLARTWSLMASAVAIGSRNITLAHNPLAMGWQIGDRIQLAPMTTSSAGTAETFVIAGMSSVHNIVTLSAATKYTYPYGTRQTESGNVLQMAAEVINLSRNIIFTGDDFRHVTCDPTLPPNVNSNSGCSCSPSIARMNCTMGLHTGMIQGGILRMQYTRVEKCGQRGVLGRYCIHMHFLNKCPQCLVRGNAIEFSQQRGIDIHQTHLSVTDYNVLSDVRGSNIFLEDGNEEYNYINYNVVICPWPIAGNKGGCSVPGTDYGLPDTSQDYSAFWSLTNLNYFIGNRAANAYSGLYLFNGNSGAGSAYNRVDPYHSPIGIIQGNTFHGGGKFGLYILSYFPKQNCTPSVDNNGEFSGVLPFCNIFTKDGGDIGKSVNVIDNNIYQQVFNGGYNIGDVQFSGMISVGNNNNLYWKETKNFQDGCAAHISNSYFESGNLAMPDNAAFIFENTQFAGSTSLETNHHCNVGNTGFLCMPTYVFSNVRFYSNQASWVQWSQVGNHYGRLKTSSHICFSLIIVSWCILLIINLIFEFL